MTRTTCFHAAVVSALTGLACAGSNFDVSHLAACGGGTSTSASFTLHGAIGQPDAGETLASPVYTFDGGVLALVTPRAPCPGDLNGDGIVGFTDLTTLLSVWGPCAPCAADIDSSGIVDFADLVLILSSWGACG